MKILHLVPGTHDVANGMVVVANLLASEQRSLGHDSLVLDVSQLQTSNLKLQTYSEIWLHGMWLPAEWLAAWRVIKQVRPASRFISSSDKTGLTCFITSPRLIRMPHGSLSPIAMTQGRLKKLLVRPIEKWIYRHTDRVVVTGEWELEWAKAYGLKNQFEITNLKRFFNLDKSPKTAQGLTSSLTSNPAVDTFKHPEGQSKGREEFAEVRKRGDQGLRENRAGLGGAAAEGASEIPSAPLRVLYLGRQHPLKGTQYLQQAVKGLPIELRIVSDAQGDAKEAAFAWCDVLCLPTLSENFGLVVAEALSRGIPVITTDGAPAWKDFDGVFKLSKGQTKGAMELRKSGDGETKVWARSDQGLEGPPSKELPNTIAPKLIYLEGYRDGDKFKRVELLRDAFASLSPMIYDIIRKNDYADYKYHVMNCSI